MPLHKTSKGFDDGYCSYACFECCEDHLQSANRGCFSPQPLPLLHLLLTVAAQSTGSKRPRHASNSEEETQEETLTTLAPNAVCLPGWSLLDLVLMRAPPGVVNDLREDVHMQPVAFALLSALAKALAFAGDFKDTHSSSMLTNPAAKPDSVLISPAWTEPTWSVLVASFEFKLRNTRSDLENMLGQVSISVFHGNTMHGTW